MFCSELVKYINGHGLLCRLTWWLQKTSIAVLCYPCIGGQFDILGMKEWS